MIIDNANIPVKRYRVPSKSQPGVKHKLLLWNDGRLECDCIASGTGRECWHVRLVRTKALNDGYNVRGIREV